MLILLACTRPEEKIPGTTTDPAPDSADTADTNTLPSLIVGEPVVAQGPLPTILQITWETAEPGIAWIEWQEDGDAQPFAHRTRSSREAATAHDFLLAGLPPKETGQWRLALETAAGVHYGDGSAFSTPDWEPLPALTVDLAGPELDGYFLMPGEDGRTIMLFDRKGRVVWKMVSQSNGFLSRTRYLDGWIWSNHWLRERVDQGTVDAIQEGLGSFEEFDTPGAHHDFWVDAEGMATVRQDRRTGPDGAIWTGDSFVWTGWDGAEVELWNSWDRVTQAGETGEDFFPGTVDWMHCNGIDREGDLFALSCKGQDAVYAIGMDGSTPWTLGGQDGTLAMGVSLDLIHGPTLEGDRLWLFSNTTLEGSDGPEILGFDLDGARTAATVAARSSLPGAEAPHFGNAIPLEGGGVMVSYGWGGVVVEFDADMEPIAKYNLKFNAAYFDYVPHFGGPVEPG